MGIVPPDDEFDFAVGDLVRVNWPDCTFLAHITEQLWDEDAIDFPPFWYEVEPIIIDHIGRHKRPFITSEREIKLVVKATRN